MPSKFIWTEEKEQELKKVWNTMAIYKIASDFGCSDKTILKKAEELKLPEYKSNRWTKEEEELLREYSKKYVAKTIARKLGKSYIAVQKKAIKLGIELHFSKDPWKKWMIDYLKDNINKVPISKITEMTGLNYNTIIKKCDELGIKVKSNKWTEEEVQILKENAQKCHYTELVKLLPGRTVGSIAAKAFELGIETNSNYYKLNEKDGKYIKENWGVMPITDIARNLGLTVGIIYRYKKEYELPDTGQQQKKWTEESINELRNLAKTKDKSYLAKKFNTSVAQIAKIASENEIKLKKDRKIIWDEKKNGQLLSLYEKGYSVSEISNAMDLKPDQIRARLRILGLKIKKASPKETWSKEQTDELINMYPKFTTKEIAIKLGKQEKVVTEKIKKLGLNETKEKKKYWTDKDTKTLIDLSNRPINEISNLMDFSEELIRAKAKECGITLKYEKRKRWTKEEEELLKEYSMTKNVNEISQLLGRTVSSVSAKLKYMKIQPAQSSYYWDSSEVEELINLSKEHTVTEIAIIMNRDINCIRNKLTKLNLKPKIKESLRRWTDEEEKNMIELLKKYSLKEVAQILNRSEEQIVIHAKKHGIKLTQKRYWTNEEEQLLTDLWGEYSIELISKKLDRSVSSIRYKAYQLKLGASIESNYDGIIISDLEELLNVDRSVILVNWVSLGLKVSKRKISEFREYSYVTIPNLLEFLKHHQNIWDSRNLEVNIFGKEPDWLIEKRKRDNIKKEYFISHEKQSSNYYIQYQDNDVGNIEESLKKHKKK